jgi:hypothetical protein
MCLVRHSHCKGVFQIVYHPDAATVKRLQGYFRALLLPAEAAEAAEACLRENSERGLLIVLWFEQVRLCE